METIEKNTLSEVLTWSEEIAPLLIIIGSLVALITLCIRFYQIHKDHKRSRVASAIDSVHVFSKASDESLVTTRSFVEKLNGEQCKNLLTSTAFEVERDLAPALSYALKDIEPDISKLEKGDEFIYLKPNHVAHLRFLALKHLNDIEIALLHWKEETGERRIFEEQLGYLVCCKSKRYIMQKFRDTYRELLGGETNPYPCIDAFVLKMKE
ncbi:hypothetical protein AB4342_14410 [Vibrio breoganii]|uniref:hypothetical protein n=1 Tax=Vibrio breoganii TaxID=553239 RepID=UPI000C846E9E|nr:hypothetical protein [Vibrio breoganii]PML61937.1 hypothetical protein BCT73_06015 [Vibrio breoganii]